MGRFAKMSGPTRRLDKIADGIEEAPHQLLERVSKAAEDHVLPLIEYGYQTRTSPYGTPWPQPVAGNEPMEINARLRTGYEVIRLISSHRWTIYMANKARAKKGAYYGAILQHGFRHWQTKQFIEPRKQVPDAGDIPPRWKQPLQDVAREQGEKWRAAMMRRGR